MVRPGSNIPLIFTNRFLLINPKIVEDCCIGTEANERTFHCQLILNMRSDVGYILKVELTGLTVGPDVRCERNQGIKDDSKVFWPEQLKKWSHQY